MQLGIVSFYLLRFKKKIENSEVSVTKKKDNEEVGIILKHVIT